MKKSLIVLAAILVIVPNSFSKQVPLETVQRAAVNWMIERSGYSINQITVKEIYPITDNSKPVYYILNMNPAGFVIVAAEDNVVPIIMYAKEGSYDPGVQLPSFDYMMNAVKAEIRNAVDNNLPPLSEAQTLWQRLSGEKPSFKKISSLAIVKPLLKTNWDQGWPYNKFCPATATGGDGGRVPTGCVATAMAQVMNYYQRPVRGIGSHSYVDPASPATGDPGYGTQSANFGSTAYDWKHMPKSLSASSDSLSINAVATLMYQCGVSVEMNYAPDGSGSYMTSLRNALSNYFRFDPGVGYIQRSAYSISDWVNAMKAELDQNRPVPYGGNDVKTSGAHAFILDGYESTDYFHVDWGWGGYLNGYFLLTNLAPGNNNFANNQSAIINIIPLDWTTFTPATSKNFRSIKTVDQNVVWICGDKGAVVHTTDNGGTWMTSLFPDPAYDLYSIEAVDASTAWVVGNKGTSGNAKIWKTSDGGNAWTVQFSSTNAGACYEAVKFYDANNGIFIGDPENNHYVIMTTTNGGSTWVKTADANVPDPLAGEKGAMNNLAIHGSMAWFGTAGSVWTTRMYRSTNQGSTWQASQVTHDVDVNLVSTSFASDLVGWTLSTDGAALKTSDGGNKWGTALATNAAQAGGIQHLGGATIAMVGGRGGFYLSTNDGSAWSPKIIPGMLRGLNAISFSPGGNGWVAGDSGAIAQWAASPPYLPLPLAPALLSPNDNALAVPTNSVLSWNDAVNATSFRIQISLTSNFSSIVFDSSGIKNTSCTANNLSNTTLYYWRVSAANSGGSSGWSNVWKFTTSIALPSTPALNAPANGATGVQKNVTLAWNASAGADSYTLFVYYKVAGVTDTVINQSGITTTSFDAKNLANNTTFSWQVKAVNSAGASNWSPAWTFTTIMGPPSAPILALPLNYATGVSVNAILLWSAPGGTASYELQVSTNNSFTAIILDTTLSSPTTILNGLANSTQYFWRVKAINAGGASNWSGAWSFTTIAAVPPAPALATPVDGATNVPTAPTLTWNSAAGASTYRLEISLTSNFSSIMLDTSLAATSKIPCGFLNNHKYFWRVNATGAGGTSPWSTVWSFTTIVVRPPTPLLKTPPDSATGIATNPTLNWNTALGAASYQFQVSTDASFSSVILDTSSSTTSKSICGLKNITTYYWHVNATNAGGVSDWSAVWNFTTEDATPIDRFGSVMPAGYFLQQNYPNPFHPSTTIEFSIPQSGFVLLRVFNVFGDVVGTLVSEELRPGAYSTQWDASGVSSGVYFYRLESGSFLETRKLTLLR